MKKVLASIVLIIFLFGGCSPGNKEPGESGPSVVLSKKAQASDASASSVSPSSAPTVISPEASIKPEVLEVPFKGELTVSPAEISNNIPEIIPNKEALSFGPEEAYEDDIYVFLKGLQYTYYAVDKKSGKATNIANGSNIINYQYNLYNADAKDGNTGITKTDINTGKATVLSGFDGKKAASMVICDGRLYCAVEEGSGTFSLFSMNLDGSGKEKVFTDTADKISIYNSKAYYIKQTESNKLHEASLTGTSHRIFNVGEKVNSVLGFYKNKAIYTFGKDANVSILDLTAGKTEAVLESGNNHVLLGQYIFYLKDKGNVSLKAYNIETGKAYAVSGLNEINGIMQKDKNAVIAGLRSTGKSLYLVLFTHKLAVYRVSLQSGNAKLTLITNK